MSAVPQISRWILVPATVAAAIQIGLLWWSDVPLGVPAEWAWDRIPYSQQHLYGWLLCGIAGAVNLFVIVAGSRRVAWARPREKAGWLVALAACGIAWIITVVGAVPEPTGLGRVPFVLYYPKSSGYFWQARFEVKNLRSFLRDYKASISDSTKPDNYLHLGTHPPGLTAAYHILWQACSNSPTLRQTVLSTEPRAVQEAFAELARNAQRTGVNLHAADEACLWLAALVTWAAIALTVFPLYWLTSRSSGDPLSGWTAAALWPLVPSLSIFFPKSDLLYPLLAVTAQWLWVVALDRKSITAGIVSAMTLMLGLLLSLALLPVAAVFALQTLVLIWQRKPVWRPVLGAVAAVASVTLAVSLWGEMNLLGIWLQNVRNHAAFYDHNTRSYFAWLITNPIELAVALGAPLTVLILAGLVHTLRSHSIDSWRRLAVVVVWVLLWLSGKNMGEAARLWCFLMPLLVWAGSRPVDGEAEHKLEPIGKSAPPACQSRWSWVPLVILALLQMVVCVSTATRVDGFHMSPAK